MFFRPIPLLLPPPRPLFYSTELELTGVSTTVPPQCRGTGFTLSHATAQPEVQVGHPKALQGMFIIGVIHTSPCRSVWNFHPVHSSRIPPIEGDLCLGSCLLFTPGF